MNARLSNAYFASIVLHGLFAAAMLLSAYAFGERSVNTKIIELVAGAGDNYGALVAPALGDPNSTKMPEPGDTSPMSAPPPPAPTAFEAVVAPPPAADPTPTPKSPNFTRTIERKLKAYETKRAKEEAAATKKAAEEAAAAEKEAARQREAEAKANHMTKAEWDKLHPNQPQPTRSSSGVPYKIAKIDTKGIREGVTGGSTENTKGGAGGTALSREEADRLTEFLSALVQRLKEAHERPTGLSDLLTAEAECAISENGTLSQVRISRSSGSPEFDQSVLSAFRNVRAVPRNDGGGMIRRQFVFRMHDD